MAATSSEPPALPVTIGELKAFLRIEGSGEDAMLAGLLRGAVDLCEAFIGQALIARDVVETIAASYRWTCLRVVPVRAIDEVACIAPDGTASLISSAAYSIDIDADGNGWLRVPPSGEASRVRVRYTAGMAEDWNGVPEPLRQGILRLAAHSYGTRGEGDAPPPASIAASWRPWRRLRAG